MMQWMPTSSRVSRPRISCWAALRASDSKLKLIHLEGVCSRHYLGYLEEHEAVAEMDFETRSYPARWSIETRGLSSSPVVCLA